MASPCVSATAAILYGAGDVGELFLCHLRLSPPSKWKSYSILGFVDDNSHLKGRRVRGFPVFGGKGRLEHLVRNRNVECVILTSGKLGEARRREVLELADRHGLMLMEWGPELDLVELKAGEGLKVEKSKV